MASAFCVMVGECGTNKAMTDRRQTRPRPPIDRARLDEIALSYVGRFATSRAKLVTYLNRKLRERGWAGETPPDLDALADRLVKNGYVDDRAYAVAKARTLTTRGFGVGRVRQALHGAGIAEQDGVEAQTVAQDGAVEAAIHFARRKRFGPYSLVVADPKARERAIASMIRAGHGFALARAIITLAPGDENSLEILRDEPPR